MSGTPGDRLFVITGGPGAGKTSLVDALAGHGMDHLPESGRAIIRAQQATGGDALPWRDRARFAACMLARDRRGWRRATARPGRVICDRGIPDVIGYLTLCGLPVPDTARHAAASCRYNRLVFVAPHWPAIYAQDAERRQDAAEAEATCRAMIATYARLGYTPVMLPLASIAARVAFVMARITDP